MTAPERPAGRPARSARPAGAQSDRKPIGRPATGRNSSATVTDPLLVRRALEVADASSATKAAAAVGVARSTVARWLERRAMEASAGLVWPSEDDVAAWQAAQPKRDRTRVVNLRWRLRRSAAGGASMMVDSTGTSRRLRALVAIGWRYEDLSGPLGVNRSRVSHLAAGMYPTVHRNTAAAVDRVYDRLCMTPGPSARCRALAASWGWPSPLAWEDELIDDPAARPHRSGDRKENGAAFDEVAVQRAIHGDRVHLRPPERAAAVAHLTAAGRSTTEIAALLDTTPRSVTRHRTTETRRSA